MRLRQESPDGKSTGLARALSKLGMCSRSRGRKFILDGRVRLNGNVCRDPERRVNLLRDRIELDSQQVRPAEKIYLMLNKPRGLVSSSSDEQGRPTVFSCLAQARLPQVSAVGRLDKASEGLLLFTNDTDLAAHLTAPESGVEKTYHVQIDRLADETLLERMRVGVTSDGKAFAAARAIILRHGTRNSWLEVVLTEGKNRHIRRMLEALGVEVLRLVRVAVGPLQLGELPKGAFRQLTAEEIEKLRGTGRSVRPRIATKPSAVEVTLPDRPG